MAKNIPVEEVLKFLNHQSKTSYSSVYLLEVHRRLFKIIKLTMQLNYSSSYSNTLLSLEKIIDKLRDDEGSGDVSFEITPLTQTEKNLIDDFSVTLVNKKAEIEVNKTIHRRYDSCEY
jgi:hypothetical protein